MGQVEAYDRVAFFATDNGLNQTSLGSTSSGLYSLTNTPIAWQEISVNNCTIPVGTNYIVSEVGFLNSSLVVSPFTAYSPSYCPGFVDNASLTVTPEPSTLALLFAGTFCLLAYVWRRRRRCRA